MQLHNSNSQPSETLILKTSSQEVIQNWLVTQLSKQLSLNSKTIDVRQSLKSYGLDSVDAVTLVGELEDWLNLELPSTLLWDYPTIEKTAQYLVKEFDISGMFP